jgi:hypothetical protein
VGCQPVPAANGAPSRGEINLLVMSGWFKLATHFLMNKAELILAGSGTALQICLFILLLVRRSYRDFPFFFAYTGIAVLNAILSMLVRNNRHIYFHVYWTYEFFYVVLAFLVLQESFRSVFRNFYNIQWFKLSFPIIGSLMIVVTALREVSMQKTEAHPIMGTLISLEIAVGFLQFGLFCLFILLVQFFHMRWQQRAFGIVLGFGVVASGYLVAFLLRSEFGKNFNPMLRIATPLSYIIGVAIWLATFVRGEPQQIAANWDSSLTPEQMIAELKRHTLTVKGILGR